MKLSASRRRAPGRWPAVWVSGLLLVAAAGTAWWVIGSRDPFAGLELEEDDHDARHALSDTPANSLIATGGVTPAGQLRLLDEQLRGNPKNPALLAAKIHLGLEHAPAVAAEECERILEQSPANYFALHHAAMAFLALTNLDRALVYAARALQVRDTPEARFVAGHIFFAKGDFPNALQHYRVILARNPRDENAQSYVEKAGRALAENKFVTALPTNNSFSVKP